MAQPPDVDDRRAQNDAEQQNIETAFALTRRAAGQYEFRLQGVEDRLMLRDKPILRWTNPERGQIYGNVYLWTDHGRPVVVGSLFKWFSPFTHMSHEFHSFASGEIVGTMDGKEVWRTSLPGVTFGPVPDAPVVAATAASRLLQMKQLARQFTAHSVDREGLKLELRPLSQPVYRYEPEATKDDLLDGALFVFVQGTDPEVWLLLEARVSTGRQQPRWEFALARMNSIDFTVEYQEKKIWHAEVLTHKEVGSHKLAYTSFLFQKP